MKLSKIQWFLLALAIVLALAIFKFYPDIRRGLYVQKMMEMDKIQSTFIQMDMHFPTKSVLKSSLPYIFPKGNEIELPQSFLWENTTYDVTKFLDSSYTQGLIVIQNDTNVYEHYWRGQTESTPHISWSMSKSFVSALMGIAIQEGYIQSINQYVEEYLPDLKGSGYEGVTIKQVLQMSTGVKFDETYGDPNSDIQRWFKAFALGESQDAFAATLVRNREPGTYNQYVSINTHVLGMILVKATGKSLTEYLQEKIWQPLGAEYDAYWISDDTGMEMALGGLNSSLRDYAKLGQLFLHKGDWHGQQLVPESWIYDSVIPDGEHVQAQSPNSDSPGIGYGYQWWIPDGDQGEFMAIGVFNQYIYINPSTHTVIVKNSANENYYDTADPYTLDLSHLELFRAIAYMHRPEHIDN